MHFSFLPFSCCSTVVWSPWGLPDNSHVVHYCRVQLAFRFTFCVFGFFSQPIKVLYRPRSNAPNNVQVNVLFYVCSQQGDFRQWTINITIEFTLLDGLKWYRLFWNNSVVIGHSSSMCLTDRIFIPHCSMNLDVTCILLLPNILHKKVSQIYFFFQVLYTQSSQVVKQSYETKVVGYCTIFQTFLSFSVEQCSL